MYDNDEGGTYHLNGTWVQLNFTIIAGILATMFITTTGLTERECLKEGCPSEVLYLKIKRLCATAAQGLLHDAVVYLMFYHKERCTVIGITAEQRSFLFYRSEIFTPSIALVRGNCTNIRVVIPSQTHS